MKTGTAEKILKESGIKLSRPTLLKDAESFNIQKTSSGENIFRWSHIIKMRYKYEFNDQIIKPVVISVCQNKGGVGKTTSVINLATALSYIGKVLIVDFDAQANSSQAFNLYPAGDEPSLISALNNPENIKEAIVEISDNLHIIPNNFYFDDWQEENRDHTQLWKILKNIKDDYSFVLIDTAPTLQFSFKTALFASNYSLIPFESQPFSLEGILNILERIKTLSDTYDRDIKNLGVFLNKYEKGVLSEQIKESIETNDDYKIFETKINKSVSLQQSQAVKQSIFDYEENSTAAYDYYNLTFEILNRILK